jgi:ABC-type transport system involved in cytochrome c biogenesis permease subunit
MNKKGLDEMQLQIRNKIGNQTFLVLLYLLLLDAGLYGFGFRWVNYPANIMLIVTICAAIYVVRLIKANAYVGPSTGKQRPILNVFLTVIMAVFIALVIIVLLKNASFSNSYQIDAMAAPILFISAMIALAIAATTSIIKKIQNKNDRDW